MDRVYLLGGQDLEMFEIEQLLKQNNCVYYNNHLQWGVVLSSYKDIFREISGTQVVGIELPDDITDKDFKYINIDHHNDNFKNDSSLEQVAKLLGVELNRYQMLVAENDKGYIPAMKEFGASDNEIEDIRKKDRLAQGCSDEDERFAVTSISKNKKEFGDLIIVYSLSSKFSPICDRLYTYKKILVYHGHELNYYGKNAKEVYEYLKLKCATTYAGGYNISYTGCIAGTEKELNQLIKDIIKMNQISTHIFMFPFTWYTENKKNELADVKKILDNNEVWKTKKFSYTNENADPPFNYSDETERYNSGNYFYPYVHEIFSSETKNDISIYYERADLSGKNYKITINEKVEKKEYSLNIQGVSLRLFRTGVGIISFHLKNYEYDDIEDINKINEYGRRVYPQFKPVDSAKRSFLAEKLAIGDEINTDFSDSNKLYLINNVLGTSFKNEENNKNEAGKIIFQEVIDDRMYVICWYETNIYKMKSLFNYKSKTGEYRYANSHEWHKYIFIEKDSTCQSRKMLPNLLESATYDRWIDYGTLYGITPWSFMCLFKEKDTPDFDFIKTHISTLYTDMVTIVLVIRASAIRFSKRVSDIISTDSEKESDKATLQSIRVLHKEYLLFVNRMYFKEVTPQIQGIELYDKLLTSMNIERDVNDLEEEIDKLHEYAQLLESKQESEILGGIGILGALVAVPSFLGTMFGTGIFPAKYQENNYMLVFFIVLTAVTSLLAIKRKKGRILWIILTAVFTMYGFLPSILQFVQEIGIKSWFLNIRCLLGK